MVRDKERMLKLVEQGKMYLEHVVEFKRTEITPQSQHILALEKEKDRFVFLEI